jgi:putative MATE family efflux protein
VHNKLEGPVGRLMLSLCTQTTFSLLLYHAYSLTDTFFVANGVGGTASGAVGIFAPELMLVNGISSTLGTGGGSVISRSLGAGDGSKGRAVVGCMMFVWLASSTVITAAGLVFLEPLLDILGCTSEIRPYALDYGRIMLLSTVVSTGFSGIMRAQGDIGYSTVQWSVPVLINLILDPVFIYGLHMGIAGAALATLIAQLFSAANSVYYFFFRKKTPCRVSVHDIRWNGPACKEIVSVGLPAFLGSLGGSLVGTLGNQVLGAVGGTAAISAFTIVSRVQSFASTPFSGVMQGIQPMLGFDFGRKNYVRIKRTMRYALRFVLVYGGFAAVTLYFTSDRVIGLFDKELLTQGGGALRVLCWALVTAGFMPIVQAYLQALGRGRQVLFLSLGSVFLIRLPALLIAGAFQSVDGVWWALAASDWLIALWAAINYINQRGAIDEKPDKK